MIVYHTRRRVIVKFISESILFYWREKLIPNEKHYCQFTSEAISWKICGWSVFAILIPRIFFGTMSIVKLWQQFFGVRILSFFDWLFTVWSVSQKCYQGTKKRKTETKTGSALHNDNSKYFQATSLLTRSAPFQLLRLR